jgi:hypothetical protein
MTRDADPSNEVDEVYEQTLNYLDGGGLTIGLWSLHNVNTLIKLGTERKTGTQKSLCA